MHTGRRGGLISPEIHDKGKKNRASFLFILSPGLLVVRMTVASASPSVEKRAEKSREGIAQNEPRLSQLACINGLLSIRLTLEKRAYSNKRCISTDDIKWNDI